mmetsp:Transcript_8732/g.13442  ORF Transcript_8732/g.13442 Transcript_8732/m.13442 type:complete len:388 (+) Transcript_8732:38-1201(+)
MIRNFTLFVVYLLVRVGETNDDRLLQQVWDMVGTESASEMSKKLIDDRFEYLRASADFSFASNDAIGVYKLKKKKLHLPIIDVQSSGQNVSALCAFLEIAPVLKVQGYVLLSLGSAAHGSPFHPAIARRLEADCDFVQGDALSALEKLLFDTKLRRWFLSQHFPSVTNSATRMRQRPGDPAVGDLAHDSRWILHPKLHHVPLGFPRIFSKNLEREQAWLELVKQQLKQSSIQRISPNPYLNFKPRPYRQAVATLVSNNLHTSQKNFYVGKQRVIRRDRSDTREYIRAMLSHRFVLSPPGSGVDCYRHWEAILCGAIPILEYTPLAIELLADLPVLIVRSWHELTPEFLQLHWQRMINTNYTYRSLSTAFWHSQLRRARHTPPTVFSS